MSGGEATIFWILGPVMVLGSLGLLFAKKAVHAALSMALVMIGLGIVYTVQQAPFLGVVQVFVYTGAVMMLFLFVLMLVGVDSADSLVETIKGQRLASFVLGLGVVVLLVGTLGNVAYPPTVGLTSVNNDGNVSALAARIFGDYVWAFEATSALLITSALGAMILAHRERLVPRATQRELAERRIRSGAVKAPLPAPGVFARHNAVDTPALLPDGTPSELSVSRVLATRNQMLRAEGHLAEVGSLLTEIEDPLFRSGGQQGGPVGDGDASTGTSVAGTGTTGASTIVPSDGVAGDGRGTTGSVANIGGRSGSGGGGA